MKLWQYVTFIVEYVISIFYMLNRIAKKLNNTPHTAHHTTTQCTTHRTTRCSTLPSTNNYPHNYPHKRTHKRTTARTSAQAYAHLARTSAQAYAHLARTSKHIKSHTTLYYLQKTSRTWLSNLAKSSATYGPSSDLLRGDGEQAPWVQEELGGPLCPALFYANWNPWTCKSHSKRSAWCSQCIKALICVIFFLPSFEMLCHLFQKSQYGFLCRE